jgi:hypothetical protein
MRTFFDRRRIAGCGLLLTAWATLGIWLQGMTNFAGLTYGTGTDAYFVSATNNGFTCHKYFYPRPTEAFRFFVERRVTVTVLNFFFDEQDLTEFKPRWSISHWLLILPQAILSACLMFWPRRQQTA